MVMKYNILKSKLSPHFENGERVRAEGHPAWRVEWEVVGQAVSIEDAKRLVAVPVLEEVK